MNCIRELICVNESTQQLHMQPHEVTLGDSRIHWLGIWVPFSTAGALEWCMPINWVLVMPNKLRVILHLSTSYKRHYTILPPVHTQMPCVWPCVQPRPALHAYQLYNFVILILYMCIAAAVNVSCPLYLLLSHMHPAINQSINYSSICRKCVIDGAVGVMDGNGVEIASGLVLQNSMGGVRYVEHWNMYNAASLFNFGLLLSLSFHLQVTSRAC